MNSATNHLQPSRRRARWGHTALLGLTAGLAATPLFAQSDFQVEEASIESMHQAIKSGATTCANIIQSYVQRARAYNGICTKLVTKDGAKVKPGKGIVRAGAPLKFPADTVAAATLLPDFDQYKGLPIEYGRMEATQSDPKSQQQYGMVVGMADAGGVNALSTFNLRGERSVTCNAKCDLHPAKGALPKSCPAVCEGFRKQPDALEWAAELDARYGKNPDLEKMPMYCVAFSFKDVFDATDMRSTGGADVSYAMDAAPEDSTIVQRRRGDERVRDWASLNANTKNYDEGRTVAMKNWENQLDMRAAGMAEKIQMREVMRMAMFKVMYQNDIDVFVNPTITIPAAKNGYASQPQVNDRPGGRFPTSANAGIPEITVPAGLNKIIYEPRFALNAAKDNYVSVANETQPTEMTPMPFGISFWGGPGDEPVVLKVAATYESATKHRVAPPAFGPLDSHQ